MINIEKEIKPTQKELALYNEYLINEECNLYGYSYAYPLNKWLKMYRTTGKTTPSYEMLQEYYKEQKAYENWERRVGSWIPCETIEGQREYEKAYQEFLKNPKLYEPKSLITRAREFFNKKCR